MSNAYKAATVILVVAILFLGANFFINSGIKPTGYFTATPGGTADVNVSVLQAVSIIVTAGSSVNLGSLYPSDSNATESGTGIILENNGSVDINITANIPTLFTSDNLPAGTNASVTCKSAASAGGSAILWQATYADCDGATTPKIIGCLTYANSTDEARVDLNVTVPTDEDSGAKIGTLTFTASAC